jgi:putative transposase
VSLPLMGRLTYPLFLAEILEQLLSGGLKPEDLTAEGELSRHLKKTLLERALGAELTQHVGYEKAICAP